MIINHNLSSAFASRVLNLRTDEIQANIEKLSSGMRINKAADDASGLAVSEKMRSQIRGLNRASLNVQDATSFLQTTEGYLEETTDVLHRMRELAVQSGNGIYNSDDRALIQVEFNQLIEELDRVASQGQFNGLNMLTGRFAASEEGVESTPLVFHIGANVDQNISINIGSATTEALGLTNLDGQVDKINIASPEEANRSLALIDTALQGVVTQRAEIGAVSSRLSYMRKGIDIGAENLQASESRIRDVNIAKEVSEYVRTQILTQTSAAVLAQANTQPQVMLSLLQ